MAFAASRTVGEETLDKTDNEAGSAEIDSVRIAKKFSKSVDLGSKIMYLPVIVLLLPPVP